MPSPPAVEIPPPQVHLRDRYHCTREDHAHARLRLRELGYPVGSDKWDAFWAGFICWARGGSEADCPIPDVTAAQRAAGRRAPHRRGAWLNGFRAGRSA